MDVGMKNVSYLFLTFPIPISMKCIHNELKLELAARRYEKLLYLNAGSIEEYTDPETIKERVRNLLSTDSPSVLLHDLFSLPPLSLQQQDPIQTQQQHNYQKQQERTTTRSNLRDAINVEPCASPVTFSPMSNVMGVMPPSTSLRSPNQRNSSQLLVSWDDTSPICSSDDPIIDRATSLTVSAPLEQGEQTRMNTLHGIDDDNFAQTTSNDGLPITDLEEKKQSSTLRFITSSRANRRRVDWMGRPPETLLAPILKTQTNTATNTKSTKDRAQRRNSMTGPDRQRRVAFTESGNRFESDQQPLVFKTYDELVEESLPYPSSKTSFLLPTGERILPSDEKWSSLKRSRQENQSNYATTSSQSLTERKRERLIELYHASNCAHNEHANSPCPVSSRCSDMKALWCHMEGCNNRKCGYPHCSSSRTILSHFQSCRFSLCDVCAPVQKQISELGSRLQPGLIVEDKLSSYSVPFDPLLVRSIKIDVMNVDDNDDLANDNGDFSQVNVDTDALCVSPTSRPTKKTHAVQEPVNSMSEKVSVALSMPTAPPGSDDKSINMDSSTKPP
jgi:TAZ zinc finger